MHYRIVCPILATLLAAAPTTPRADSGDSKTLVLLSLVVPGLGQWRAGARGAATAFIAAEIAIWGAYWYNTEMKDARGEDYLAYAVLHAGVNPEGRGTAYLNAVGAYDSAYEYNESQYMRSSSPVLYTGAQIWSWDVSDSRLRFRNLRERELDYENNVKFCIAGLALNHLLAALHASKLSDGSPPDGTLNVRTLDRGLAATYTRSF